MNQTTYYYGISTLHDLIEYELAYTTYNLVSNTTTNLLSFFKNNINIQYTNDINSLYEYCIKQNSFSDTTEIIKIENALNYLELHYKDLKLQYNSFPKLNTFKVNNNIMDYDSIKKTLVNVDTWKNDLINTYNLELNNTYSTFIESFIIKESKAVLVNLKRLLSQNVYLDRKTRTDYIKKDKYYTILPTEENNQIIEIPISVPNGLFDYTYHYKLNFKNSNKHDVLFTPQLTGYYKLKLVKTSVSSEPVGDGQYSFYINQPYQQHGITISGETDPAFALLTENEQITIRIQNPYPSSWSSSLREDIDTELLIIPYVKSVELDILNMALKFYDSLFNEIDSYVYDGTTFTFDSIITKLKLQIVNFQEQLILIDAREITFTANEKFAINTYAFVLIKVIKTVNAQLGVTCYKKLTIKE